MTPAKGISRHPTPPSAVNDSLSSYSCAWHILGLETVCCRDPEMVSSAAKGHLVCVIIEAYPMQQDF